MESFKRYLKENSWKRIGYGNEFSDPKMGAIVKNTFGKVAPKLPTTSPVSNLAGKQLSQKIASIASQRDKGVGLATGLAIPDRTIDTIALTAAGGGGAARAAGGVGKLGKIAKNLIRPSGRTLYGKAATATALATGPGNLAVTQYNRGADAVEKITGRRPNVGQIARATVGAARDTGLGELGKSFDPRSSTSMLPMRGLTKGAMELGAGVASAPAVVAARLTNVMPSKPWANIKNTVADKVSSTTPPIGDNKFRNKLISNLGTVMANDQNRATQRAAERAKKVAAKNVAKTQYTLDNLRKQGHQFSGPSRRTVRQSGSIVPPRNQKAVGPVVRANQAKAATAAATPPKKTGWLGGLFKKK